MGVILFILILGVVVFVALSQLNGNDSEIDEAKASAREKILAVVSETNVKFKASRVIVEPNSEFGFALDASSKKWMLVLSRGARFVCYNFNDLISYEVVDNGTEILSSNVGNAAIGGVLFGAVGAIAGASASREISKTCNDLHIEVIVNDIQTPRYILTLIKEECSRESPQYKAKSNFVKELTSLLAYITANVSEKPVAEPQCKIETSGKSGVVDIYDELEKLHGLKEKGIITEEEFQKKKESMLWI